MNGAVIVTELRSGRTKSRPLVRNFLLIQDLVHLERRRDRLDQHGGADRAAREAQEVLGQAERVVPQAGLGVALHLGQVEVRALAFVDLFACRRHHVQREVGEAAGRALPIDQDVLLVQVPAARADHDRGQLVVRVQRVDLALVAGEVDGPVQRVLQVELAGDHVVPQWRVGVLEVSQPDVRAGVQRVDRHLAVGGAGDLDPPVDQAGRGLSDPPGRVVTRIPRLRQEVERAAGLELGLAGPSGRERLLPAVGQLGVEGRDEVYRPRREDLVVAVTVRAGDLHMSSSRHVRSSFGRAVTS
jgi:hypothetical protein